MSEPFDEISTAAERAREHLREDFEQLRAEIEVEVEEIPGGSSPAGGGNRNKAWASFAAFALAGAVAATAANFALNGGRASKDSGVSVPPSSSQPAPGGITGAAGSPRVSSPFLAATPPTLQFEVFGSNAAPLGAPSPFPSAESVFVVGALTPVGERGVPSENVAGADPVNRPPAAGQAPGPPLAQPEAPRELAYTPPPPLPPPDGGHGGGEGPGEGPDSGGGGEKPPHGGGSDGGGDSGGGEKPPHGGGSDDGGDGGSHGNGLGKGHTKGRGKGHDGDSPGKGHEKYDGGEGTAMPDQPGTSGHSDSGDAVAANPDSGRTKEHGKGHEKNHGSDNAPAESEEDQGGSPGHGHEKDRDPAPPAAPPPAEPAPASEPDSGSSENPGRGHGKSGAPGQVGK